MSPTWYDVLGVDRDATPDEVRTAWRRSIADLDPSDRRFRSANEAAEVLLDADRRRAYDASLPAEEEPVPVPEPVPVAATRPDERSTTGEDPAGRSGRRLPVLLLAVVGVLAVATVVLAAVVWFRPHVDPDEVGTAQSAAEQAIVPVLSYDYRELEEDAEAARSYLTEDYQEEYTQLFTVISDNAPRTEAVVRAEVIASSVVRTSPDAVEVLLFVNRPTTNKQVTEPVVYRDQVTVTMVREGDEWRVDRLQTTPAPE